MAEKKSKYLVWLETLHREYTERTCITQLGRQAASLQLLADMYEVRCRFEIILSRLKNEAIQLVDDDLNYQEWYNREKWKVSDITFQDEDIRETFGIKLDSPLAQTYANTMLTPFGDGANFDNDRFRNVVSSLFVLNDIVDEQKMEVAVNSELEKLLKVLLDISNAKNRKKDPEEYAAWFENEIVRFRRNFITKSKIKAEHDTWKKSIYDDDYKEALKERRVELLLELFDSGFLDDLKVKCHRKAEDVLGFKNYEYEKWEERTDEAVRYFAAMCKICPFMDDMISFDDHAKIGRYILDEHIEDPMVNAFLRAMELIMMIQKEMVILDDPNVLDMADNPTKLFVESVKTVMLKAEEKNGETIKYKDKKNNESEYKFYIAGKSFCKIIDEIQEKRPNQIIDYLDGKVGESAVCLTKVCPFIGRIVELKIFNDDLLRKKDLEPAFQFVFGEKNERGQKRSFIQKMSETKDIKDKPIFETLKTLFEEHKRS